MVGTHQFVGCGHVEKFVYRAGVYQVVAAHDGFFAAEGHGTIVEMIHLEQGTVLGAIEARLLQRLADIGIV